jgi:signal transduction histidine kinase
MAARRTGWTCCSGGFDMSEQRPSLPVTTSARAAALFSPRSRPKLFGYLASVLMVAAATALTLHLWQAGMSRNPFALFYAAVVLAAWWGGLGPGLLATALAVWTIDYLFMPAFHHMWGDLVHVGTFTGVAVLISSLSARSRHALDAAKSANQAKDQFLAVLSHELRTPLTPSLVAVTQMQDDQRLPIDAREDLQMVRRNLELEARLIDDLLDLTRISRGKIQLCNTPVDVHELIQHVIGISRGEAAGQRLDLRVELLAKRHCVMGDSSRLHQIVWNLVKNAAKFTPEGGRITICTADAADRVAIEVRDTGIGIDAQALPHIFDAFKQVEGSGPRRYGGLGLGLTISRALAEVHGGELTAHSDGAGRGACFRLELPSLDQHASTVAVEPDGAPVAPARQLRVLLVEDHEDTLHVMCRLLRQCRYEVETAGTVRAALEQAGRQRYDVVISDIGLPDGTGFELMQKLRDQYQLKGIALTGYGMEDDVRRSRDAGFAAHLTKPVNFNSLRAVIQQVAA